MKIINFTIMVFTFTCAFGFAATIYVPDDYATIQDAISAAGNGDTVTVRPGTYVENVDFMGKALTLHSEQGPAVTMIDGNASGSVVTFKSGEGLDSVLDGFTVTNGSGTVDPDHPEYLYTGGGIYCKAASPTIMNNIMTGNLTDNSGGILCIDGSNAKVMKNVITQNQAVGVGETGAGGIGVAFDSAPEIVDNLISENVAVSMAGGIGILGTCSPIVKNNTITKNTATYGAGIQIGYDSAGLIEGNVISQNVSTDFAGGIGCGISCTTVFSNNIIVGNSSDARGGGLYIYTDSDVTITNNTIFGNTATSGGGIACGAGSSSTVANTILWDNSASTGPEIWIGGAMSPSTVTISYSDLDGGQSSVFVGSGCTLNWNSGMVDADPIFADSAADDFHLTWMSPCRDSGDDEASGLQPTDNEGDPRIALGEPDMGADEYYYHLYHMGDVIPGSPIDLKVVGYPTAPISLYLGSGLADPPYSTQHGDFFLNWPPLWQGYLGTVPGDGVLVFPAAVPTGWISGSEHPLQALVGPWGGPWTRLTNAEVLVVE